VKHTHSWSVKGFSQCDCRYLETSIKPVASDPSIVFRIRLHPQGNKESNKDFTFFQVFCSNTQTRYRAKFTVHNSRNEEIATTVYTGQQQLHGYFEYIRRDALLNYLLPSDELQLLLELVITFDTVTKSCYTRPTQVEPKHQEVAKDLEGIYREGKLTDFLIIAGGREISCHKAILAARSPFFAAMFAEHTEEAKQKRVRFDDLDYDVVDEMLHYIYSGTSPNLKDMAPDLLAAADRFQLTGLKDMADQVLRVSLNNENACRVLVLADMHGAKELKLEAVRYVAQNKTQVIQTDGWQHMIANNPGLITEVVAAIEADQLMAPSASSSSSTTGGLSEPASKRIRL